MLTPAQLIILRDAILADPVLVLKPMNSDGDFDIAAALNLPYTPDFFVWRTSVGTNEITQNGFTWTEVDGLSVGKARIWDWMMRTGFINPSQSNVRAGIVEAFKTIGQQSMRVSIFGHCQRLATRAEKLFATGVGSTATEAGTGPAIMGFEGSLQYTDVAQARAL